MNPLPLSRIAQWTNGRLHEADGAGDVLIESLFTDTRTFDAGDGRAALFVALAGERFDGNDHVQAAAEAGARAALVSRPAPVRIPQVVVADTGHALAAIAAAMQHGRPARVAAITGSNGKTGVKQMLLSILRQVGPSHANPGNFNNEIGLPLAVIQCPEEARFAIYEMGAGKPGDIAWLTAVARPDVAARQVQVGEAGSRFVLVTSRGEAAVELPLAGRHNVANALAAASMAIGMAEVAPEVIAAGLARAEPVAGRLVRHRLASGALLIDDSYNANPGSLAAAIETLAATAGERWLVLGEMGELGEDAQALHAGVGRRAREAGIEKLFALGALGRAAVDAFGEGGAHFDTHEALATALRAGLHPQARVLVKGSRSSAMERIVSALLQDNGGDPTHAA